MEYNEQLQYLLGLITILTFILHILSQADYVTNTVVSLHQMEITQENLL